PPGAALDESPHASRQVGRPAEAKLLVEAANKADTDRWRSRVRTAAASGDVRTLEALAASPARAAEPPESQLLLASSLKNAGKPELALQVLADAGRLHPGDYDIHHELGMTHRDAEKPDIQEAIRQFSMALALRPKSPHAIVDLAQVFLQAGNAAACERLLDEARRLDPTY